MVMLEFYQQCSIDRFCLYSSNFVSDFHLCIVSEGEGCGDSPLLSPTLCLSGATKLLNILCYLRPMTGEKIAFSFSSLHSLQRESLHSLIKVTMATEEISEAEPC